MLLLLVLYRKFLSLCLFLRILQRPEDIEARGSSSYSTVVAEQSILGIIGRQETGNDNERVVFFFLLGCQGGRYRKWQGRSYFATMDT